MRLKNSSFEDSFDGWVNENPDYTTFTLLTSGAKVGSGCLQITGSPGIGTVSGVAVRQDVYAVASSPEIPPAFHAGESYMFGLWLCSYGSVVGQVSLEGFSKGEQPQSTGTPFTLGSDWTWIAAQLDLKSDFFGLRCRVTAVLPPYVPFNIRLDGAMLV